MGKKGKGNDDSNHKELLQKIAELEDRLDSGEQERTRLQEKVDSTASELGTADTIIQKLESDAKTATTIAEAHKEELKKQQVIDSTAKQERGSLGQELGTERTERTEADHTIEGTLTRVQDELKTAKRVAKLHRIGSYCFAILAIILAVVSMTREESEGQVARKERGDTHTTLVSQETISKIDLLIKIGRCKDAQSEAQGLLERYNENPDYWVAYAKACYYCGDFDGADSSWTISRQLDENNPYTRINLAAAKIDRDPKYHVPALKLLMEARDSLCCCPDLFNNLGVLYHRAESYEVAACYFDSALIHNPSHKGALANIGSLPKGVVCTSIKESVSL